MKQLLLIKIFFEHVECFFSLVERLFVENYLKINQPMNNFQIRNAPVPSDLAAFSRIYYLKIDQWAIFKYEMHPCPPTWRPFNFCPFPIWKSTNDRFSNTKCTRALRFGGLVVHFLFENRPMIDVQIRNAPVPSDLAAFLSISYLKIDQ